MKDDKISMFLAMHQKDLPRNKLPFVQDSLTRLPDEKFNLLNCLDFKSSTTNLIVSILVGSLGIDRFLVGDVGLGVLKLLTGGVCGIMTIVDWFLISERTKKYNFDLLKPYLV